MYRCQNCNAVVPSNHKMNRVVVETREKSYAVYRNAKGRSRKPVQEHVGSSTGFEIVRELAVCTPCARSLAEASAAA